MAYTRDQVDEILARRDKSLRAERPEGMKPTSLRAVKYKHTVLFDGKDDDFAFCTIASQGHIGTYYLTFESFAPKGSYFKVVAKRRGRVHNINAFRQGAPANMVNASINHAGYYYSWHTNKMFYDEETGEWGPKIGSAINQQFSSYEELVLWCLDKLKIRKPSFSISSPPGVGK